MILTDRRFRLPRKWSNRELLQFSGRFQGVIANVSGWRDEDKEGKHYKDYFTGASEYWITNYKSNARGFQGCMDNEIYLDLIARLPESYQNRFDVVFNHTVLEHIFEVDQAFSNLCGLSADVVIVVVPMLQEQHATYGDYWRFTPLCLKRMFEQRGLELVYINWNQHKSSSVYIIAIASKAPTRWGSIRSNPKNRLAGIEQEFAGTNSIRNTHLFKAMCLGRSLARRLYALAVPAGPQILGSQMK